MNDYTALLHRIVRSLATVEAFALENVLSCVCDAANCNRLGEFQSGRKCLDRAAQHLWGSYPPEGIKVDNNWHYTVIFP